MNLLISLFCITGVLTIDNSPLAIQQILVSYTNLETQHKMDTVFQTNAYGSFQLCMDQTEIDSIIEVYVLFAKPYEGVFYQKINSYKNDTIQLAFNTTKDFDKITIKANRKKRKPSSFILGLKPVMPFDILGYDDLVLKISRASERHKYVTLPSFGTEIEDVEAIKSQNLYLLKGEYLIYAFSDGPYYTLCLSDIYFKYVDKTKRLVENANAEYIGVPFKSSQGLKVKVRLKDCQKR